MQLLGIGIITLFTLIFLFPPPHSCEGSLIPLDTYQIPFQKSTITSNIFQQESLNHHADPIAQLRCEALPTECYDECIAYNEAWDNYVTCLRGCIFFDFSCRHYELLLEIASEELDECMSSPELNSIKS